PASSLHVSVAPLIAIFVPSSSLIASQARVPVCYSPVVRDSPLLAYRSSPATPCSRVCSPRPSLHLAVASDHHRSAPVRVDSQVSRQYLSAIFAFSSRDLCASVISQNIITCSIILNFLNVQMPPHREPDHPAPTQATVVTQFRDYHAEKFSGQKDPRIVDEWIQGLEFIFEVMECPERYRVICAQLQLTGDARLWWNAYWSMRPGEKAGCTWEMFKELIREKYYPTYYRAEMERQFLSLQQGTRTVDEYEREFTRLAAFVPDLVCTEAQRAQRFIDGLYPAVRHNIVGHGTQTYACAVSIAQEVDASIRREAVRDKFQPSAPAQSSSVPPLPALPSTQPPKNNKRRGKGAPADKRTRRRLQQIP
ncbi:Unknown protein, partial [Striga hermonthica]